MELQQTTDLVTFFAFEFDLFRHVDGKPWKTNAWIEQPIGTGNENNVIG